MAFLAQAFESSNPVPVNPVREVYIECGLKRGDSFAYALTKPFRRLYGIEVCQRHFDACVQRFGGDGGTNPCLCCGFSQTRSIHLGSTLELLPRVLDPTKETTIFIDSHWSEEGDDEMDPRAGQCPLLAELQIIAATPWVTRPLLLIDEKRIFLGELWKDERVNPRFIRDQWPTMGDIVSALQRWNFNYTVRSDQIWAW